MADRSNLEQSVVGSDEIFDFDCVDCLNNGTSTKAYFYCPECTKYICTQCINCPHDVIGRTNMAKWGRPAARDQFDRCQRHSTKLIQLYCKEDDAVCCPVCKQSDHKQCGDSAYIPLVANAAENESGLNRVKTGLEELQRKTEEVSKYITTMMSGLDQIEDHLVTGVKQFRARVNALLDEMEQTSLYDIKKFIQSIKDMYALEIAKCDTIKSGINKDFQNKFDTSVQDERLLFSHIKLGNEWVRDKDKLLYDIASLREVDKVEFEPYEKIHALLESLQGLGKVMTEPTIDSPNISGSVKDKNTHKHDLGTRLATSDKPNKPAQKTSLSVDHSLTQRIGKAKQSVSTVSQHVASNKLYKTENKTSFNVKQCRITGMCMMPSGHLILADYRNDSLKMVSSQYEVTASCSLPARPWGVCHTEADQVAVALVGKTVQLVTVSGSMSCTSSFSTYHDCSSLAYSNKCLYITQSGDTSVYVFNLAGTRLRVITQDQHGDQLFFSINHITTSRDGERLHITDNKGLVTMDTSANLISRFTSGELTNGADAVCTDGEGNVFVGGNDSDNVLQVDGETGKKLGEIIAHRDGISVDRLCFDGVSTKLLVSGYKSDTINVLHLLK